MESFKITHWKGIHKMARSCRDESEFKMKLTHKIPGAYTLIYRYSFGNFQGDL
jgi:hypothetical protein